MVHQSIVKWADRPWLPWLVWGPAAAFIAYQYSFQTCAAIMVQHWMRDFHLSEMGVGFLSSTYFYTYLLMQVPAGILLDHCSYRRLLLIGISMFLCGLIVFSMTHSLNVAIVARLMMGMSTAPAVSATLCLASNWFSVSRFLLIAGLTEVIGAMGGLLGEGFMAQWVQSLGWRHTLWVLAVIGGVLLCAVWYWVYDTPVDAPPRRRLEKMGAGAILSRARHGLMEVVGHRRIWLNGAFCGLTFAVNSSFAGLWGVPFCRVVFHLPYETSARVVSIFFIGLMIGGVILHRISSLFRCPARLMQAAALGSLVTMAGLILLSSFPHLLGPALPPLMLAFFLMGIFSATYIVPFANIRDLISPCARGTAMAFTNTCCIALGAPILQPLFGIILNRYHVSVGASVSNGHAAVHAFQWCLFILLGCVFLAWVIATVLKSDPVPEDTVAAMA